MQDEDDSGPKASSKPFRDDDYEGPLPIGAANSKSHLDLSNQAGSSHDVNET